MHEPRFAKGEAMRRCMYSDASLLLRGPLYYQHFLVPETLKGNRTRVYSNHIDEWSDFLTCSKTYIKQLLRQEASLVRYKFLLGILDNVRCLAITLIVAAHVHARLSATVDTTLAAGVAAEINQALDELGVRDKVEVKVSSQ